MMNWEINHLATLLHAFCRGTTKYLQNRVPIRDSFGTPKIRTSESRTEVICLEKITTSVGNWQIHNALN